MPHVVVKMYPGRTEEQKQDLTKRIAADLIAATGCTEASISIAIEEVAKEAWKDQVYGPEIMNGPGKLYRKPGYEM